MCSVYYFCFARQNTGFLSLKFSGRTEYQETWLLCVAVINIFEALKYNLGLMWVLDLFIVNSYTDHNQ